MTVPSISLRFIKGSPKKKVHFCTAYGKIKLNLCEMFVYSSAEDKQIMYVTARSLPKPYLIINSKDTY